MRLNPLLKILFLLSLLTFSAAYSAAQQPAENAPGRTAETLGENERLPFMQSENAATPAEDMGAGGMLVRTLGAMLLIVGLIFGGAWGLKKFGFGGLKPSSATDVPELTILSTVSLGSQRTLSVVRFGERVLLVGATAQNFTLLADEAASEKLSSSNPRSVAQLLAEENVLFEAELEQAENRLEFFSGRGEES